MCVNIEVILPTIERFLLLYSLRSGSILILFWTLMRTLFCVVFFSNAILEVLIGKQSPGGRWLLQVKPETEYTYVVYYSFIILLLSESIILLFMIHLAIGLFCYKTHLLVHYLNIRFFMWLFEITALIVVSLVHKLLIGWYLGILFFVVLEAYAFVVVYSYYVQLISIEKEPCKVKNDVTIDL